MKPSTNQDTLSPTYWRESTRPLACLAFVAPILAIYEVGILWLGAEATRNGAEVYLRFLLESIGFGQYFLLPLLIGAILLAWHHATGLPWQVRPPTIWLMSLESFVLGFVLLLLANGYLWLFSAVSPTSVAASASSETAQKLDQLISYFGAGIYEELLFRLMLLPTTAIVVRMCGGSSRLSWTVAIIVTSLVFSAVHYQVFTFNDHADAFAWNTFIFRFLAGVAFSVLFVVRGFGIAVGVHAMYDVLLVIFA